MTRLAALVVSTLLATAIGPASAAYAGPQPDTAGMAGTTRGHITWLNVFSDDDPGQHGGALCHAAFGLADGHDAGLPPAVRLAVAGRRSALAAFAMGNPGSRSGDRRDLRAMLLLVAGACGSLVPGLEIHPTEPDGTSPVVNPPPR